MRKLLFLVAMLLPVAVSAVTYDVVPLPQSVDMQKGAPFILDGSVQILSPVELQQEADFLQQYMEDMVGIKPSISQKREKKLRYIELSVSPKVSASEGYVLTRYNNPGWFCRRCFLWHPNTQKIYRWAPAPSCRSHY